MASLSAGSRGCSPAPIAVAGVLWVIGVGEAGCPAFTESGIECLKHIIIEERALLARKLDPNR